jgi:glucose/arabinose dehydrogenase
MVVRMSARAIALASFASLCLACDDDSPAPVDASSRPDVVAQKDAATSDAAAAKDAANGGGDAMAKDSGTPPPPVNCVGPNALDAYVADPKLCVYVYAQGLTGARQMAFAANGDLFVSNNGELTVLWDADKNGFSDNAERALFAKPSGLNHGVVFAPAQDFVYASSASTVYRWTYSKGQRSAQGNPQVVIKDMPDGGGHDKRPLVFDSKGRLYVDIGSANNVDTSASDLELRSQIRRFDLGALPAGGIDYKSGELVATGMRNETGLYIDAQDNLWGVENERDNLSDADLGGDIHNDNPGEEINFVDGTGSKHYGYPFCFSEFAIANGGKGRGTQWADQSLPAELVKTDSYCSDPANVHPPAWVMPAHWAPLGIIQYTGRSLPYRGDLIVTAHGSWNRMPASGRVIARAKLENGTITELTSIVGEKGADGKLKEGTWSARPVDVRQGPDDALYVSDDAGARVLKIGYRN